MWDARNAAARGRISCLAFGGGKPRRRERRTAEIRVFRPLLRDSSHLWLRLFALARSGLLCVRRAFGLRLVVAVLAVHVRLALLVLRQLRLRSHDQAVIMLRMLKVVFRLNAVAAGMRVARQLQVFFVDMRGGAADFHVRPVRIHRPAQDVLRPVLVLLVMLLMLSAAPAIVPSPAPLAVLLILSWSHEHRFLALIQIV
jgi:hypothetical protein